MKNEYLINHKEAVSNTPRILYPETIFFDGVLGCVRSVFSSMLRVVPTDQELLDMYRLKVHSYTSKSIRDIGILNDYSVIYGCDKQETFSFDTVLELLKAGCYIMLRTGYQMSHWVLLLGYYPYSTTCDLSKCLIYDPCIDEVMLTNTNSLISTWLVEEDNVELYGDFIAIQNDNRRPYSKGV